MMSVERFETQNLTLSNLADSADWTNSQQLRLTFQNAPVGFTAGIFCALVVVVLLWPVVDNQGLIFWLASIAILTLLRLMMQQRYTRNLPRITNYRLWHYGFVATAFASGCLWGSLSVFLFPETSLLHQACLTFILGGVSAGAVSVYAPLPGAYPFFVLPAMIPYAYQIWDLGESEGQPMAALIMLFVFILMRAARESRRHVCDILDLQVRNAELTRRLHHRATHDSLVDLVNHGEFNRRLERLTKDNRRENTEYSLVFIDLDLFKDVNDTGGHAAGDLILKGIANILRNHIRAGDTAARVGGDEFALLLDGCPHDRALEIAEALRAEIAAMTVTSDGIDYSVRASIGVSYGHAGKHSATGMLKAADAACYSAKEKGRNRVCINPASDLFQTTDRFQLTQSIVA
jgi:diguanylate cyclase (GGDEF)-like protein